MNHRLAKKADSRNDNSAPTLRKRKAPKTRAFFYNRLVTGAGDTKNLDYLRKSAKAREGRTKTMGLKTNSLNTTARRGEREAAGV